MEWKSFDDVIRKFCQHLKYKKIGRNGGLVMNWASFGRNKNVATIFFYVRKNLTGKYVNYQKYHLWIHPAKKYLSNLAPLKAIF